MTRDGIRTETIINGVRLSTSSGSSEQRPTAKRQSFAGVVGLLALGGFVFAIVGLVWLGSEDGSAPGPVPSEALDAGAPGVGNEALSEAELIAVAERDIIDIQESLVQWHWTYPDYGYPTVLRDGQFLHVGTVVHTLSLATADFTFLGTVDNACVEARFLPPGVESGEPLVTAVSRSVSGLNTPYTGQECPANFQEAGRAEIPGLQLPMTVREEYYFPVAGTCVNYERLPPPAWTNEPEIAVVVVDCAEPHEFETFAVGFVDDGDYPRETVLKRQVEVACDAAFLAFAGRDVAEDESIFATYPQSSEWAEGDRHYACAVLSRSNSGGGSVRG